MRERASAEKIDSLMRYLGQNVDQELRIYLCSGTSIVYWGLRETSLDVDLKVEGGSIGQILREAKQKLNINIEPEHPGRFIPLLPTWRDRSPFIRKEGNISFFHFDPYSVVVSKIVRGEEKDWADIHSLIESGRVDPQRLRSLYFEAEYQNELKERFELDIQRISEHVKLLDKENK